ncbi:hypothetical protein GEV33_004621 [Tenebrio molitor]|uniref:Uncharacterized protein n=1 Tax=Tenebrio molitor TaxID=7067 RepID=A0A8J6LD95_TENMO|nr:hypothetical protein GEV33_004621 [Tenebrio molitor]
MFKTEAINLVERSRTHRDGNVHGLPPKNSRRSDKSWEPGKDGKVHGCEEWLTGRHSEVHEAVGDDSSRYHLPKSPNASRTSDLTATGLRTERFSGSKSRQVLAVQIVPGLTGRSRIYQPPKSGRSSGRTLFIHGFTVSAGSDLVNIELSASTTISCDASEKGSAFHPLIFSRFAVNGVGRLLVGFASNREARGIISHLFVRDKQTPMWDLIRFCVRFGEPSVVKIVNPLLRSDLDFLGSRSSILLRLHHVHTSTCRTLNYPLQLPYLNT